MSEAGDLVSGMIHLEPSLGKNLPESWKLLKVWQENELPARSAPVWLDLCLALMGYALADGDLPLACFCGMAFQGLLRTGEAQALTLNSFDFGCRGGTFVVNLGRTKGGRRKGLKNESVISKDQVLLTLLLKRFEGADLGTRLLPKSDPEMRRCFRKLILRCGLSPDDYKPYSLRRGGSTHLYKITGNMGLVVERGRWSSIRTARIYVQEAEAMLKQMRLTAGQLDRVAKGKQAFLSICSVAA